MKGVKISKQTPIDMNVALKLPKANIADPQSELDKAPIPFEALNLPKFFSRSSLLEYLNSKAYSQTMLLAYVVPTMILIVTDVQKKTIELSNVDAKPIIKNALAITTPAAQMTVSTPKILA